MRSKLNISDPFDTYDFLMSESEAIGVQSRFFIKTGHTSQRYDNFHNWNSKKLSTLLDSIRNRGHLLGHHPSYETYNKLDAHLEEVERFKEVASVTKDLHSRQHFLRWAFPDTLHLNTQLGIAADYTLGFNDRIGFRCGTSHGFAAFNLVDNTETTLYFKPLIFMECALLAKIQTGSYIYETYNATREVIEHCRVHQGTFSFVWHNSHFKNKADYNFYQHLMKV